MPIYEYRCNACEHEFEVLQSISDDPLTDCPACKQSTLRKKLSVAAFHLKGTGWYETDFKTKSKEKDSSKDGAKEKQSDSSKKSETTTDSSGSTKKATDKTQSAGTNAAAS